MPRTGFKDEIKRLVVKIGSSSLTENNLISQKKIANFVEEIVSLRSKGIEVIIVSSGAISAGAGKLNISKKNLSIPQRQALAAVGQTILMNTYQSVFEKHDIGIAQVLMTEDDVKNRKRFLNIRNTLNELLSMGIVPIVNENDTVVVTEIKLGENDTLSAHVSNIAEAQMLVLLSDIDGFYYDLNDEIPADIIKQIDDKIMKKAGGTGSEHGSGGMITKLKAADIIMNCGQTMVIANASEKGILDKIISGEKKGTVFLKSQSNMPAKKKWIAYNLKSRGKIIIDDGAVTALVVNKKSLLAIGITESEGEFIQGDAVDIVSHNNEIVGKGIINYTSKEINIIKGKNSKQIDEILGEHYYDEVIHRDNLSILKNN